MKLCNETLEQELYRSFCRSCFYRVRIKATAWMAGERDNVDGSGMVLRGTDLCGGSASYTTPIVGYDFIAQ